MKTPYALAGKTCPQCGSEGPFLLDSEDRFTFNPDGTLDFPEGDWGLDIDCDCPACGLGARVEDFIEWVEVSDETRAAVVKALRP